MVEFGKKLIQQRYDAWADYYLNYKALKRLLKQAYPECLDEDDEIVEAASKEDNDSSPTSASALVVANTNIDLEKQKEQQQQKKHKQQDLSPTVAAHEFRILLDHEIEKIVLFWLDTQGSLASRLARLRQHAWNNHLAIVDPSSSLVSSPSSLLSRDEIMDAYSQVGEELILLVNFVELNVTGLRKILKKHDKKCSRAKVNTANTSDTTTTTSSDALTLVVASNAERFEKLTQRYMAPYFTNSQDSHLHQMYHYGGIAALAETLRKGLLELDHYNSPTLDSRNLIAPVHQQQSPQVQFASSPHDQTTTTTSTALAEDAASSSFAKNRQRIMSNIYKARKKLEQSSTYVQNMAAKSAIFFDVESSSDNDGEYSAGGGGLFSAGGGLGRSSVLWLDANLQQQPMSKLQRRQWISSLLNLISTFLYMTNYYIVAPTSGPYAAKLGMSEALSGIIIGMTPCAALVASVLYSYWSNGSFKFALLFAATCSVVGDVVYALALPYRSVTMCLVGRLLNGFGGARAINRRYIADAFSRDERTSASADFVTAGALGMAAGPALAAAANYVTPTTTTNYWWTVETAPGWIMFVLWSIYWITAFYFFEEPLRRRRKSTEPISKISLVEMSTPESFPLLALDNQLNGHGGASNGYAATANSVEVNDNKVDHYDPKEKLVPVVDKKMSLWTNIPVLTTLTIYFVLKLLLECLLSSTAIVTSFYFHWNVTQSGIFLAILGLLMFPANVLVSRYSRLYDDRDLILTTIASLFVGSVGILYLFGPSYTVVQFLIFAVCIFVSANMLEGPNMALLSKTIPTAWAKGTFNSGLLATEAGTFGRAVGDFIITGAGLYGLDKLLNLTFGPLALLVLLTTLLTWKLYPHLLPDDDEAD